jgi:hypothetical protein
MGFYSFKVYSTAEVDLPEHLVTVGVGQDVFLARVEDLDAFKERLQLEGISVIQVHQLDAHEAIEPVPEIRLLQGKLSTTLGDTHGQSVLGSAADDILGSED